MSRPLLALTLFVITSAITACSSSVERPDDSGQGGSGQGSSGQGGSGHGGSGHGGSGHGGSGQGGSGGQGDACPEGMGLVYDEPGCDATPICSPPPRPCVEEFCGCNGETIYGCEVTFAPYQYKGACTDATRARDMGETPAPGAP